MEDVFPGAQLFARGRFALFEGLRALAEVRRVRRLWAPAYLCRPVVDAATAAGLEIALYDIDERLQPRWPTVAPLRGDALLAVHYFGLALPRLALQEFCTAHHMPLVEDCAHAMPDPGAAVRVGSCGALAVFSLRKLGPVPGGGLLLVNDPDLRPAVRVPAGSGIGDRRTLARLGIMLVERLAYALDCNVLPLKDRLPVLDARDEAATGPSPEAPLTPAQYSRPPAPVFTLGPMLARFDWRAQIDLRRSAYRRLASSLGDTPGVTLPVAVPPPGSVPQAMPIWVADPERTVRRLRAHGVEAMCWPGREQVAFCAHANPGTAAWLDRGVLLPLGHGRTGPRLDRMLDVVREAVSLPVRGSGLGVAMPSDRPGR
jgi:hypothetical protein